MNVTDVMKRTYGNEVYTAAYLMDQQAVEQIESAYQEAWDSGTGFAPVSMFDDESEIKTCVKQMHGSLKNLVTKAWLNRYTRDEITALCGLLLKGPYERHTRIRLVSDVEVDADDIAREWSKSHPDESPVYLPGHDIG